MKKRRKFKAHGYNPLKQYRRRFTDDQVMRMAENARRIRLQDRQPAELAFEEILKDLGLKEGGDYVLEKVKQNGDRFILIDFFLVGRNIAIEIDGGCHKAQAEYDRGRTEWLGSKGITTLRFWNKDVLETPEIVIARLKEILDEKSSPSPAHAHVSQPEGVHS